MVRRIPCTVDPLWPAGPKAGPSGAGEENLAGCSRDPTLEHLVRAPRLDERQRRTESPLEFPRGEECPDPGQRLPIHVDQDERGTDAAPCRLRRVRLRYGGYERSAGPQHAERTRLEVAAHGIDDDVDRADDILESRGAGIDHGVRTEAADI